MGFKIPDLSWISSLIVSAAVLSPHLGPIGADHPIAGTRRHFCTNLFYPSCKILNIISPNLYPNLLEKWCFGGFLSNHRPLIEKDGGWGGRPLQCEDVDLRCLPSPRGPSRCQTASLCLKKVGIWMIITLGGFSSCIGWRGQSSSELCAQGRMGRCLVIRIFIVEFLWLWLWLWLWWSRELSHRGV